MPLADEAPALPVIELRSSTIGGLRHAPSHRWRETLLVAGLLSEVDPTDDPDDPRGWLRALQGLLGELVALEERRDGLLWVDDRLFLHDAPWWLWVALLFQPWLAIELGRRQPDDTDKFVMMGLIYGIPGLIAISIGVSAAMLIRRRRHERKAELNAVKDRIRQVRADLAEGALRTLSRDFVARSGERLLVCTPSLLQATAEEAEHLTAAVEALKRQPPETWVDLDRSGTSAG